MKCGHDSRAWMSSVMVIINNDDDRVGIWHSFRFTGASRLRFDCMQVKFIDIIHSKWRRWDSFHANIISKFQSACNSNESNFHHVCAFTSTNGMFRVFAYVELEFPSIHFSPRRLQFALSIEIVIRNSKKVCDSLICFLQHSRKMTQKMISDLKLNLQEEAKQCMNVWCNDWWNVNICRTRKMRSNKSINQ